MFDSAVRFFGSKKKAAAACGTALVLIFLCVQIPHANAALKTAVAAESESASDLQDHQYYYQNNMQEFCKKQQKSGLNNKQSKTNAADKNKPAECTTDDSAEQAMIKGREWGIYWSYPKD